MTGVRPDDSLPATPSPSPPDFRNQNGLLNAASSNNMTSLRKASGPTIAHMNNGSPTNGQLSPGSPWGPPVNNPVNGASGKSGKFIERLQNENATLRRDYNVERSAKEEAQKSLSTSKAIEAKFRAENERLSVLQTTNERAIERKNRKIDELKASLDHESDRRRKAEESEQSMATQLDQTQSETNKAIAEAISAQKRAETNAEALRDGLQRLQARYERQVQTMAKDLAALKKKQQEDRAKILALEVAGDQGRNELKHSDDIILQMGNLMKTYKATQEEMVTSLQQEARNMRQAAHERTQTGEQLLTEMRDTKDKMNWTISMHHHNEQKQQRRKSGNGLNGMRQSPRK